MKTLNDYDTGRAAAIEELKNYFSKIETKERNLLIGKIAAELEVSFTAVWNFATGIGTSYRTAIRILEILKKIKR